MICYHYPPLGSVGAKRSARFAESLPSQGITPHVISVLRSGEAWALYAGDSTPAAAVTRTWEFPLGKLLGLLQGVSSRICSLLGVTLERNYFRDFFCIPDAQITWFFVLPSLSKATTSDVIYVSCSPFSSALGGVLLKLWSGKPLILDFRDPWSMNPHSNKLPLAQWIEDKLEALCLKNSDALLLNTPGTLELYRQKFPSLSKQMHWIPNSYAPSSPLTKMPSDGTYRIIHLGSFYGKRSPDLLLEALELLNDPSIEFIQIGPSHPSLERYKGPLKVTLVGSLPQPEALQQMRAASLLYLRQGFENQHESYVPIAAKTYDYLASGLPILIHAPEGDNVELVRSFALEYQAVCEDSVSQLKDAVLHLRKSSETYQPQVKEEFCQQFSPASTTKQLADIVKRCSAP